MYLVLLHGRVNGYCNCQLNSETIRAEAPCGSTCELPHSEWSAVPCFDDGVVYIVFDIIIARSLCVNKKSDLLVLEI